MAKPTTDAVKAAMRVMAAVQIDAGFGAGLAALTLGVRAAASLHKDAGLRCAQVEALFDALVERLGEARDALLAEFQAVPGSEVAPVLGSDDWRQHSRCGWVKGGS
jgi:hypothetical protein